jgi:hypothetical protein
MFSFPTQSPEGRPQLDWYLPDGSKVAYSVSLPPSAGEEYWEHYQNDGTLVGKSIRVPEGHAHYTTTDDFFAESETLAEFWKLCELDLPELTTGSEKKQPIDPPTADLEMSAAPVVETAAPAVNLSGVKATAAIAITAMLASFALLLAPLETFSQRMPRTQHPSAAAVDTSPMPTGAANMEPARNAAKSEQVIVLSNPPQTTSTNSGPMAQTARDFLTRLRQLENNHAVEAIIPCYAERVIYFDHGIVDRDFIRQDKETYFRHWPTARYEIQGDVTFEGGNPQRSYVNTVASYVSSFELKNADGRQITGTARTHYNLTWKNDHFEITSERAEVLNKVVADTGRPATTFAVSSMEEVRAMAVHLRELENNQSLEAVMKNYADKVQYYKDGLVDRADVKKDKSEYFLRWPVAKQTIVGEVQVSRLKDGLYEVSYHSDFHASNPSTQKAVEGRCHCLLTLHRLDGAFQVVQEGGEVLYKHDTGPGLSTAPTGKPANSQPASKGAPKKKAKDEAFRDSVRRFSQF